MAEIEQACGSHDLTGRCRVTAVGISAADCGREQRVPNFNAIHPGGISLKTPKNVKLVARSVRQGVGGAPKPLGFILWGP